MTRKKPAIRARPIRGVLTSDAEYTEQLRQWHIEAMFTLLVCRRVFVVRPQSPL